jgi:hypothetical protein
MANQPLSQNLAFDIELTLSATTFDGTAKLLGVLRNEPVILLVKNQTSVPVFFADNSGSEAGTTMIAGEEFVLDCRGNKGNAVNMGFPLGTSFFVTAAVGTGLFKVSILYAK